jgi:hypothetical protein
VRSYKKRWFEQNGAKIFYFHEKVCVLVLSSRVHASRSRRKACIAIQASSHVFATMQGEKTALGFIDCLEISTVRCVLLR